MKDPKPGEIQGLNQDLIQPNMKLNIWQRTVTSYTKKQENMTLIMMKVNRKRSRYDQDDGNIDKDIKTALCWVTCLGKEEENIMQSEEEWKI